MKLATLIGFALTGLATYALVYTWTRDRRASIVAGSLFAFNTHADQPSPRAGDRLLGPFGCRRVPRFSVAITVGSA